MRARRLWFGILGTLALACLPAPAGAQPVGSEFQVNTYTTSSQTTRDSGNLTAADARGNFVVVWSSQGQDGYWYGIFGQRFDSAGGALADEFRVNSFTTNNQRFPAVASAASGNFVVVWSSRDQDGSYYGIFGQRYDSTGVALGGEFRVNTYTTGFQLYPSVAAAADGDFVVVWSGDGQDDLAGIFGQRYDSLGGALGSEFRVNSVTDRASRTPSVASDASGNFVVVWTRQYYNGDGLGIFGQRYDSEGVAQGDEFRVNSYTTSRQTDPSIASDARGNFVVVWDSSGQDDLGNWGVFGQRYDNEGVAQGDEFRVNSYTTNRQIFSSVASDASGNFLVAWHSSDSQDGSGDGVFGQRYDSQGIAQGDEFQINSYTTVFQHHPSVGATGTNQFVVVWTSHGQDGSYAGVFGQRFNFASINVVSPNTNVRWQVGSVQRVKWTHALGLNMTFRIELDRDDDGNYEELIAAAAAADSPTRGHFAWIVTGPASTTARVRVSWTDDVGVSDSSDVTFQIRPL
jgi:hypothetical protein